jgi:hypothetical protein
MDEVYSIPRQHMNLKENHASPFQIIKMKTGIYRYF